MRTLLKRSVSLLMAMILCFAFAACSDKKTDKQDKKPADTVTQQDQKDPAPQSDPSDPTESVPQTEPSDPTEPAPNTEPSTPATPDPEPQQPDNDPTDNPPPVGGITPTAASDAFFSEAAFIGDSVTLKLRNYHTANGVLGNTTFLCQGSYSAAHAVNNTMYLNYQGQETTPQDALAACGAKRVFILLGMNDIALWGIDQTIVNWGKLVSNIRAKCPDIEIYIQSGTPIYLDGEIGSLNNANMDAYNVRLQAFAAENGCTYVDVNTPFKNASGGLASAYCSDEYVHFTDAACQLWVKILMEYVK